MKYRKKPVVIEAMQYKYHGDSDEMERVWGENFSNVAIYNAPGFPEDADELVELVTPEGDMKVTLGDWIIKGVKGEFYICKPDIFEMTYERVE